MLDINGLCARAENTEILHSLTLSLPTPGFTAVLGRNGCGKSTFVSCFCGRAFSGSISYNGTELAGFSPRKRARVVSVMPQLLPVPCVTVNELVSMGRNPYTGLTGRPSSNDTEAVEDAMRLTSTADLAERNIRTLSGGELRRAYLAMLLAQDTPLCLLDEPCASLDLDRRFEFLTLLKRLSIKKTIITIMHEPDDAVAFADNIIALESGRLVFCGTTEDCISQNIIQALFDCVMIEAQGNRFFKK